MFHLFSRLPLELRSEIWLCAMPEPRLVRLKERVTERFNEDEYYHELFTNLHGSIVDEECEEWASARICYARSMIPTLYKIDPGLQHFSQVWKGNRAGRFLGKLQTQLESFGFTSNHARPEIPLHLLKDCSDIAEVYEATRRGYLWSRCPIPSLLHTCRESRSIMQYAGYELAFRHRTSGPRTWFNFSHDTLYLSNPYSGPFGGPSSSLDRGPWNIGQLSPDDIMRVQRLALGEVHDYRTEWLSHAIRLFGKLNEVLLVRDHRLASFELEDSTADLREFELAPGQDGWGHVETEGDLWRPMDCTVADVFSNRWRDQNRGERIFGALRVHIVQKGRDEQTFWSSKTAGIETFLEVKKRWAVACKAAPWKIPKVRIVQVVTACQEEEMIRHRQEYASRGQPA